MAEISPKDRRLGLLSEAPKAQGKEMIFVMNDYSLPRRIWRILYPPLIFIGIQFIVMFFIAAAIVAAYGVQAAIQGAPSLDLTTLADNLMRFVSEKSIIIVLISNIASFALFLPIWLSTRKHAQPSVNLNPVALGLLVAGFFAGFNIVEMMIFGLTDIMRFFPSYNEVSDLLSGGSLVMQIISVGVAAPVVEELVFRGILISRMRWLPAWAAVLIQAALFGLVHMNLFQGLYAFLAGLLLGWVFVKYRSIIMVIIGHMAYNLTSVLLGEFLDDKMAVFVLPLSAIVAVACIVALIRRDGARGGEERETQAAT